MSARLLLDTHALLWVLLSPDRIPGPTLDLIRAAETEVTVSAASAWEIAIKHRLGKLPEAQAVVHGYEHHLRRLRAEELPVTSRHALTAGMLAWDHRDPFDRMIATQSMVESLTLVTRDSAFSALPGLRLAW